MSTAAKIGLGVLIGGILFMGACAALIVVGAGMEEVASEDPYAAGDEWCDSEEGDRLAQLESVVTETEGHARIKRLQDRMLDLTEDAPPGAYCADTAIHNSFITHWNAFAADPAAQRFEPRKQVKLLRRFIKEHRFDEGYE